MDEPRPVDLSPLDPCHHPERWQRVVDATMQRVDRVLAAAGGQAASFACDVSDYAAVKSALAEAERLALMAAHPYEGCVECEHSRGWRPVGRSVERCPCYERHQVKLAQLGVGSQPLALPAGRHAEFSAVGEE